MSPTHQKSWRELERHPVLLFGCYALVIALILLLASVGSATAVVGIALLLAGLVAVVVWWSGQPVPARPRGKADGTPDDSKPMPTAPEEPEGMKR